MSDMEHSRKYVTKTPVPGGYCGGPNKSTFKVKSSGQLDAVCGDKTYCISGGMMWQS